MVGFQGQFLVGSNIGLKICQATHQSRSCSEFISSYPGNANVDFDINSDLDVSELFGDDTASHLSMKAAPHEPSSLNEISEQPFDDDLFDGLEQFYNQDF